jgi:hypothetical protein
MTPIAAIVSILTSINQSENSMKKKRKVKKRLRASTLMVKRNDSQLICLRPKVTLTDVNYIHMVSAVNC